MVDWEQRFIELAKFVAEWSRDPERKVGAVVVGADKGVRAVGYNGLPRGIDERVEERHSRKDGLKEVWLEHAERNAIYSAARAGIALNGCRIFVSWIPCMDCARAIVQVGIVEVVALHRDFDDPRWTASFRAAMELFREAGVKVTCVGRE